MTKITLPFCISTRHKNVCVNTSPRQSAEPCKLHEQYALNQQLGDPCRALLCLSEAVFAMTSREGADRPNAASILGVSYVIDCQQHIRLQFAMYRWVLKHFSTLILLGLSGTASHTQKLPKNHQKHCSPYMWEIFLKKVSPGFSGPCKLMPGWSTPPVAARGPCRLGTTVRPRPDVFAGLWAGVQGGSMTSASDTLRLYDVSTMWSKASAYV